jgi:hypothetical protein
MKTFTIKNDPAFRISAKQWKCISPSTLNALEITQDCMNKDGAVVVSTVNQYFLTDAEIKAFAEGLLT